MLKYECPPDSPYEVIGGEYVEKRSSLLSQIFRSLFFSQLTSYALEKELGWFVVETLFAMPDSPQKRRPDLAFVSYAQWPEDKPFPDEDGWLLAPEIAVEVISPTNSAADLMDKLEEYFHCGVREVWIIYPEHQGIEIHSSATEVRVLLPHDTLTCPRFLPGFALPLAGIFVKSSPKAE